MHMVGLNVQFDDIAAKLVAKGMDAVMGLPPYLTVKDLVTTLGYPNYMILTAPKYVI